MASNFLAAATSPQPVEVAVSHVSVTIPPLPASDWLIALSSGNPVNAVLPGLLGERDDTRLWEASLSGRVTEADIEKAAYAAITDASGRKWWEAIKLVGIADANPQVVGRLTLKGVEPRSIPLARWCAAVYTLLLENQDDKERMKFEARLATPPAGVDIDELDGGMSFESMVAQARNIPGLRVG